jgi:hypothetical protein
MMPCSLHYCLLLFVSVRVVNERIGVLVFLARPSFLDPLRLSARAHPTSCDRRCEAMTSLTTPSVATTSGCSEIQPTPITDGSHDSPLFTATAQDVRLISFLAQLGTFRTAHSRASLASHLLGTYGLLTLAGQPAALCLAGGLHSIYGTNVFQRSTLDSAKQQQRQVVIAQFGNEAEMFAFLFHSINRPRGLEDPTQLRRWKAPSSLDPQLQEEPLALTAEQLRALQLLEAANFVEQDLSLKQLPVIAEVWESAVQALHRTEVPFPSPRLFLRFLHFTIDGVHLPAQRVSSLTLALLPAFEAHLLLLYRSIRPAGLAGGETGDGHRVIGVFMRGAQGAVERARLPWDGETLCTLRSNCPCTPGHCRPSSCSAYELEVQLITQQQPL